MTLRGDVGVLYFEFLKISPLCFHIAEELSSREMQFHSAVCQLVQRIRANQSPSFTYSDDSFFDMGSVLSKGNRYQKT